MIINNERINRRKFLKAGAGSATGLVIAYFIPMPLKKALGISSAMASDAAPTKGLPSELFSPNAFIQISSDDTITIMINKLEMGQGVNTSMSQLIAEELNCDWKKIRAISAPVAPAYNHTMFGTQMTGGSTALASSWDQHRRVGAMAREMLISAAAEKWGVKTSECRADKGFVIHKTKGKLSYGSLAEAAAKQTPPSDITLKPAKDFKVIGRSMPRVDASSKSAGQAVFGGDVYLENLLHAVVARPPAFGAKLKGVDDRAARAVSGVVDVIKIPSGVAVVGKNTWAALQGRNALQLEWDTQLSREVSSESMFSDYRKAALEAGSPARREGDAPAALAKSKEKIEATYEFPYLAHACMEPMNCTIDFNGTTARVWSGHQMPTVDRDMAAKVLGIEPAKVEVTTTYAGGSFGRRASKHSDFVVEAAELAKVLKKPVHLMWTREDDTRGGYYRPLTLHRAEVGFDAKKNISGWKHSIVGQSVVGDSFFEAMMIKDGVDSTMVEGVADSRYSIADFSVDCHLKKQAVSVLWWRSVGHTHTAYVMETLMDEVAEKSKRDPLQLRRQLLKNSPRHLAVLDLLAKKSGWGKRKPAKGHAFGLALHESFGSVVGQVVEISLEDSEISVHKVWCAVHCGQVVNPEGARAQVESALVYGISAALYGEVEIKEGVPQQSNFHDYRVMRLNEMPEVDVAFVKSSDPPTGLGEPGLPPIAPAIANAFYRLSKKRVRRLPMARSLGELA